MATFISVYPTLSMHVADGISIKKHILQGGGAKSSFGVGTFGYGI